MLSNHGHQRTSVFVNSKLLKLFYIFSIIYLNLLSFHFPAPQYLLESSSSSLFIFWLGRFENIMLSTLGAILSHFFFDAGIVTMF